MRLAAGAVAFAAGARPFAGGRLVVRVEEVSRADAPARELARATVDGVAYGGGGGERVPFAVRGPRPPAGDAGDAYAVRAHVALGARDRARPGGDDDVRAGDYVSVEHLPVAPPDPRPVLVWVHPVP